MPPHTINNMKMATAVINRFSFFLDIPANANAKETTSNIAESITQLINSFTVSILRQYSNRYPHFHMSK